MFKKFNINYNDEPVVFRKGSIQIKVKEKIEGKKKEKQVIH